MFQNTFILRKARVANFADIIKFETMFIKATFKYLKKKVMYQNAICFQETLMISGEKMLMAAELKECVK